MRAVTCRVSASTCFDVAYFAPASDVSTVRTLRGSNPGFTARRPTNVRMRSRAPISSTTAGDISATTRTPRVRPTRMPVDPRSPPSFSASPRLAPARCSAGARPKRTPVTTPMPAVKPSSRQSRIDRSNGASARSAARGRSPGLSAMSACAPHTPMPSPIAAPADDSSMLSTSTWRMMSPRPAPMAARIAISFCRAADRASRRFATFAQAISRTSATAPSSTSSAGRASRTRCSCIASTLTVSVRSIHCGVARRNSSPSSFISARAVSIVMPAFKRAATLRKCPWFALLGSGCSGRKTSALGSGRNRSDRMPTTMYGSPLSAIGLPTVDGSRPKRVAHNECASTAT